MEIGRLNPLESTLATSGLINPTTKSVEGSKGFLDILKQSLDKVSQTQNAAGSLSTQYMLNQNDVTLEDTMIASQKANISFQMAVQVRNKLVTAYQEIMNMQI